MKKIVAMVSVMAMLAAGMVGCKKDAGLDKKLAENKNKKSYTVGVCQLMKHDSLDAATQGFQDALKEEVEKAGKTVNIEVQVAGDSAKCTTVINTYTAKEVDLIMGNATPALLAAATATGDIPVLGTSVTDYKVTFEGTIPGNVSGTSDAVPFDEQAKMMIETLGLKSGDKVGVLYCTNEINSKLQYEAVKAEFQASGISAVAYTFAEANQMQAVVTKMMSECVAIYVPSDNTVANNESILANACNGKIPVYTSYASSVSYASLAIDYYELGRETGKMAAQILLEGKSPASIEIKTLTPTKIYNKELCGQLGITVPAE